MWGYLRHMLLWVVAIMSGFLVILREVLQIYNSEKLQSLSLFWNCAVIAFIITAGILWFLEHRKVVNLTFQLYLNRQRIYKEFIVEKFRLIDANRQAITLNMHIFSLKHQNEMLKGSNSDIWQTLKNDIDKYERAQKDKDEANARFTGLLTELKLHFGNSLKLTLLIQEASMLPDYKFEEPSQDDLKDADFFLKWIKRIEVNKDKFIHDRISKPLENLAEYLQQNLK